MVKPRSRRGRGQKRSSALTVQRRLWLVSRFVRSPATPAELIADARRAFGESIYPPNALVALRHDFNALRNEFLCEIVRQPNGSYALTDFGRLTLLNIPDDELEALAFLVSFFGEESWPNSHQIRSLLDHIIALLPPERRQNLDRQHNVEIELPQSSTSIDPNLLNRLQRNLRRYAIRFLYRSNFSNEPEEHRVAPARLFLRDGHTYLEAYCYNSPHQATIGRYIPYRVDRIIPESLHVERRVLPPELPPRRMWTLRYRLSPQVARNRDIALWFPNSEVTYYLDGSAEVTAQTGDLWQAEQILLRYREHCRVLEPPELVEMIRQTIERMRTLYDV
ncbi:helix-turn-helix transcriptional regulator [Chloroflexus aggregans]|uniref:Transcriptional regulator-like protein n=1 Tax=Chloroflexus aggregans (strain MD-66 / DSM 9485) TaxID=326427 RepID=B8GCY4_CHLAD|nr:WYL domain-containing protein [Chloroflexus aggregans]ACL23184.1 transcriptional regulator-like protein [Chloroflexus aggregans DSM 9485]